MLGRLEVPKPEMGLEGRVDKLWGPSAFCNNTCLKSVVGVGMMVNHIRNRTALGGPCQQQSARHKYRCLCKLVQWWWDTVAVAQLCEMHMSGRYCTATTALYIVTQNCLVIHAADCEMPLHRQAADQHTGRWNSLQLEAHLT